jgi:hypothetical protein
LLALSAVACPNEAPPNSTVLVPGSGITVYLSDATFQCRRDLGLVGSVTYRCGNLTVGSVICGRW